MAKQCIFISFKKTWASDMPEMAVILIVKTGGFEIFDGLQFLSYDDCEPAVS